MKNQNNESILVIGGTGNVGTLLVDLLKTKQANFKVLVRSADKQAKLTDQGIDTVMGALGDWDSIELALEGIDTVFLLSSPEMNFLALHTGLIDRAVASGVRKIVRMSSQPAQTNPEVPMYDMHIKADHYLEQSGLQYAILRPDYFMQNMENMHVPYIKEQSMFAQYLGEARIPMVDTRDIASAAYHCLMSDDFNGKTHYITGPESISFYDVAKALSDALGRQINYVALTEDDQINGLKAAGVPDPVIAGVMTVFKGWVEAKVRLPQSDFEKITGGKAISIEQYSKDFAQAL